LSEKKKLYCEYREVKENMKKYVLAKHNVDEFLKKTHLEESEQTKKNKNVTR
jgi:hypothetical protein